jgi:hypothetical protein
MIQNIKKVLSKKEKQSLIEKCKNHPRLKQFVHVKYPNGLYEKFKRYIFPGYESYFLTFFQSSIYLDSYDTFFILVLFALFGSTSYIYWV